MITTALLFLFSADAYLICGDNARHECLMWVDRCLERHSTLEPDMAFEVCAELLPPELVDGSSPL